MKQKPIIFNTEMVKAILDGRKIETRRIIKPQPKYARAIYDKDPEVNVTPRITHDCEKGSGIVWEFNSPKYGFSEASIIENICPYGKPGDLLWVRETWQHTECLNIHQWDELYGYVYKANGEPWDEYEGWQWKPSIYMPKNAARIWLKIEDVRAERLQDITEEGAEREGLKSTRKVYKDGIGYMYGLSASEWFQELWNSIHGPGAWEQNPWVWVVKFSVLSVNGKPEINQL